MDAILGKAERKMRAWVYADLTGSEQSMEEIADEQDVSPALPAPAAVLSASQAVPGPVPDDGDDRAAAPEAPPGIDHPLDEPVVDMVSQLYFKLMGLKTQHELSDFAVQLVQQRAAIGEASYQALLQARMQRMTALGFTPVHNVRQVT